MKLVSKIFAGALVVGVLASCSVTKTVSVANANIGSKKGVSSSIVLFGTLYLNQKYGAAEAIKKGKLSGGVAVIDEKTTYFGLVGAQTRLAGTPGLIMKKELIVIGE